jgi:hypothetical protein
LIGSTLFACFAMCWGWIEVRSERRINYGLGAFLSGLMLWAYSINSWLNWWLCT